MLTAMTDGGARDCGCGCESDSTGAGGDNLME